TAHSRDHVVSGLELRDVRTNRFDAAETFMSDDQIIESRRRSAVFCGIDLFVGAVHADAQDFDENASAVLYLVERRFRRIRKMDAAGFAGKYADCFHLELSSQIQSAAADATAAPLLWRVSASPLCCMSLVTTPVQPV